MANENHKKGTDDGWHGVIEEGGQFPPEKDRYHLYIGMDTSPIRISSCHFRHLWWTEGYTKLEPQQLVSTFPFKLDLQSRVLTVYRPLLSLCAQGKSSPSYQASARLHHNLRRETLSKGCRGSARLAWLAFPSVR
jgi:hypothetical protein